jgi:hypothetical protein
MADIGIKGLGTGQEDAAEHDKAGVPAVTK